MFEMGQALILIMFWALTFFLFAYFVDFFLVCVCGWVECVYKKYVGFKLSEAPEAKNKNIQQPAEVII